MHGGLSVSISVKPASSAEEQVNVVISSASFSNHFRSFVYLISPTALLPVFSVLAIRSGIQINHIERAYVFSVDCMEWVSAALYTSS